MELAGVFALEFVYLNHDEDLLATLDFGLQVKTGDGIKFDVAPAAGKNSAVAVAASVPAFPTRAQSRAVVAVR